MRSKNGELVRVLGTSTTLLVGLGIAIGSGILRTPQLVAAELISPVWILVAWALGGAALFASSLVMAELATRFPESGGEYAWLREAYGPFTAFFFGWGYTIFVVGGGAATIAAAFGDAAAQLAGGGSARGWAGASVCVVVLLNMLGLATGSALQNTLTGLKVGALMVLVVVSVRLGPPGTQDSITATVPSGAAWLAAMPAVIWAYAGSTDAVKLAGEVENPNKKIPVALFSAIGTLTIIYLLVNGAFLYALGPEGLASTPFPVTEVAQRAFGPPGEVIAAGASALIFLGALSSTVLATTRVAWALGRDGHGFGFLGRMTRRQAPVGALAFVGAIALVLALARDFEQILGIYFLAASLLFALVYVSLLVFRARDGGCLPDRGVFRCPTPYLIVGFLVLMQLGMAGLVVVRAPRDAAGTLVLLVLIAVAYRWTRGTVSEDMEREES